MRPGYDHSSRVPEKKSIVGKRCHKPERTLLTSRNYVGEQNTDKWDRGCRKKNWYG